MALKRTKKEEIKTTLTLIGQGDKITFEITYFNRKQSEVDAVIENPDRKMHERLVDTLIFMVKEWDSEYPLTEEGLKELEDDRPGTIMGIIEGFHAARQVTRSKN